MTRIKDPQKIDFLINFYNKIMALWIRVHFKKRFIMDNDNKSKGNGISLIKFNFEYLLLWTLSLFIYIYI